MPYKYKEDRKEWANNNRDKIAQYHQTYIKKNPEAMKRKRLKENYGLTMEDYQRMLEKSGGICVICKNRFRFGKREPCIDHDHVTGEVRGLLCYHCNVGLGHFRDNKDILQRAVNYLKEDERC